MKHKRLLYLFLILSLLFSFLPITSAKAKLTKKIKKDYKEAIFDYLFMNEWSPDTFFKIDSSFLEGKTGVEIALATTSFSLIDINKDGVEELLLSTYGQSTMNDQSIMTSEKRKFSINNPPGWKDKPLKVSSQLQPLSYNISSIYSKGVRFSLYGHGAIFDNYYLIDKNHNLKLFASYVYTSYQDSTTYQVGTKTVSEKVFKKALKKLGKEEKFYYTNLDSKDIRKYLE